MKYLQALHERCAFYLRRCLETPDQTASRLYHAGNVNCPNWGNWLANDFWEPSGAIFALGKVVRRYRSASDKLAFNHAINCLVVYANLHTGRYHEAIRSTGPDCLEELRTKLRQLEHFMELRRSTDLAEQAAIESLRTLLQG